MVQAREFDRLDAAAGLDDPTAPRLDEVVEELHVELVVLYDQHGFDHGKIQEKRRRGPNFTSERGEL